MLEITDFIGEVTFSEKDIIDIFSKAFKILLAEEEYNFNLERHNAELSITAITKGCGCKYCELRNLLRVTKIAKIKHKRYVERMWDIFNDSERNIQTQITKDYVEMINNIRKEKKTVKIKLGLIHVQNNKIRKKEF